jgi:hypothetical protein
MTPLDAAEPKTQETIPQLQDKEIWTPSKPEEMATPA